MIKRVSRRGGTRDKCWYEEFELFRNNWLASILSVRSDRWKLDRERYRWSVVDSRLIGNRERYLLTRNIQRHDDGGKTCLKYGGRRCVINQIYLTELRARERVTENVVTLRPFATSRPNVRPRLSKEEITRLEAIWSFDTRQILTRSSSNLPSQLWTRTTFRRTFEISQFFSGEGRFSFDNLRL